ncbi:hypothetical protein CYLTODRAFT_203267 [Cylindrobasidium torrendii FP15055 ss-10]|uniref:Uncharacterized protein n=1 Tax=Cylindrobasidium torrendii FP15055 ss-10 TaxID=1314674 RepID=A0A0D7AX27_9AGAR|nr:hypothetical protein CYLTODRAFT_203267 [Cylindrobasidium torrendii FP15055 ss-10]
MTTLHPFQTSRESILPIWSQPNQARRSLPDANVADLFVLLHGMLFTNVDLDAFQPTLSRFVERLEIEGAEDRDWIMMAVVNIGSILEYGKPSGVLKRLGGVGSRDPGTAAAMRVMAKREAMADESMDVDAAPSSATSPPTAEELDLPLQLQLAMQLAFEMFSYVLQRPTRKPSPFARSTINPYLTVLLTFLSTILKHTGSREVLERSIPWDALAAFFATVPRTVMSSQHLDHVMPADARRWDMITSGCAPPLPEDWCLRGMEWVGRKVFERGYWRSGLEKKVEQEVLNAAEEEDMTDGHIEDDDDEEGEQGSYGKRWVRLVRCAIEVTGAVDGLEWTQGTREWRVEGALAQKVAVWKEQARVENEEAERRRGGTRWADDAMEVDDEGILGASEESDEDSDNDTPEIRALKVCASCGTDLYVLIVFRNAAVTSRASFRTHNGHRLQRHPPAVQNAHRPTTRALSLLSNQATLSWLSTPTFFYRRSLCSRLWSKASGGL